MVAPAAARVPGSAAAMVADKSHVHDAAPAAAPAAAFAVAPTQAAVAAVSSRLLVYMDSTLVEDMDTCGEYMRVLRSDALSARVFADITAWLDAQYAEAPVRATCRPLVIAPPGAGVDFAREAVAAPAAARTAAPGGRAATATRGVIGASAGDGGVARAAGGGAAAAAGGGARDGAPMLDRWAGSTTMTRDTADTVMRATLIRHGKDIVDERVRMVRDVGIAVDEDALAAKWAAVTAARNSDIMLFLASVYAHGEDPTAWFLPPPATDATVAEIVSAGLEDMSSTDKARAYDLSARDGAGALRPRYMLVFACILAVDDPLYLTDIQKVRRSVGPFVKECVKTAERLSGLSALVLQFADAFFRDARAHELTKNEAVAVAVALLRTLPVPSDVRTLLACVPAPAVRAFREHAIWMFHDATVRECARARGTAGGPRRPRTTRRSYALSCGTRSLGCGGRQYAVCSACIRMHSRLAPCARARTRLSARAQKFKHDVLGRVQSRGQAWSAAGACKIDTAASDDGAAAGVGDSAAGHDSR